MTKVKLKRLPGFVLHEASPQKRARKRIIKSIGIRQFKRQQRRFIAQQESL
jgi:hypothetical protein